MLERRRWAVACATAVLISGALPAGARPASPAEGRDPNLPVLSHGTYVDAVANQYNVSSVFVDYPDEPGARPVIRVVVGAMPYAATYHGYTSQGSWVTSADLTGAGPAGAEAKPYCIRIVRDQASLVIGTEMNASELKMPGGAAAGAWKRTRDPNLPVSETSTSFSAGSNAYNLTAVDVLYPDGPGSQPVVHTIRDGKPGLAGYLGYDEAGSWFVNNMLEPRLRGLFTLRVSDGVATVTRQTALPSDLPSPSPRLGAGGVPLSKVNPLAGHDAKITHDGAKVTLTYLDAAQRPYSYVVVRPVFMQQLPAGGDDGAWIYVAPDRKSAISFNFSHGSVTGQAMNPLLIPTTVGP